MTTLKEKHEKERNQWVQHAEVMLMYTAYHQGQLYVGSGIDTDNVRTRLWLEARDEFVKKHMKEINKLAHDKIMGYIGD